MSARRRFWVGMALAAVAGIALAVAQAPFGAGCVVVAVGAMVFVPWVMLR